MKLTVSTLTAGNRAHWLDECRESVRTGLPQGAEHVVHTIPVGADFQLERWAATMAAGDGYVAWVDDDDLVTPDALRMCVQALDETGAGIAFTHEDRIDEFGAPVPSSPQRPISRRDVAMHPRQLHHLAVIRLQCLDPEVLRIAVEIGIGIEWLMRAWCALKHGAIQVPLVGYHWRQHDTQESRTRQWNDRYALAMSALRATLLPMVGRDALIHRFVPR